MKPIDLVVWLPFNRAAITLFPFILYSKDYRDDRCTHIHEYYHWYQALRWGVIPWYAWYMILWLKFGYGQNHPLERHPYQLETECRKEIK